MEYRKLPKGEEKIGVLGIGLGGIQNAPAEEIEAVVRKAIDNGINYFDACGGGASIYEPFGKAIKGQREKVYFQLHFGAVYNEKGEYGWSRDLNRIKETLDWELKTLGTDYIDFGFLHCIDEDTDFEEIKSSGIFDYVLNLKKIGVVHHLGFSSHTPSVANKMLDEGVFDMMMFSINPAYDMEQGDEYGKGSVGERRALFQRCVAEGVGISVMKPFFAGQLLDEKTSPFKKALTREQCIQYALDRPAVMTVLPGVRNVTDIDELLKYTTASKEEKDYSIIGEFTPELTQGTCVYCNHCQPCPMGIDIGLVNKYYDLSLAGDKMAHNHYDKISVKADACIACGHCEGRCPFKVKQEARMQQIAAYFSK